MRWGGEAAYQFRTAGLSRQQTIAGLLNAKAWSQGSDEVSARLPARRLRKHDGRLSRGFLWKATAHIINR